MVDVRIADVRDWEQMKVLLDEVVSEKPPVALELEPLLMKGKEWIRQFPRKSQGYFVVAEENNMIIGFCYLVVPKFYKPVAYIGIVVQKRFRRREIGTQLFYTVAVWAAAKHLTYILADVWVWNKRSIQFFEDLGFKESSRFMDKFRGVDKEKVRLVKDV
jgi:RimJ/RimL family protein N-acetyltransferase